MSSHLSCEYQDVKIAADKTFGLYLFIRGNHIRGSTEGSAEHNNKRTIQSVNPGIIQHSTLKDPYRKHRPEQT